MKRISVEQIVNDVVVARDVCGASGNVLIGKGAKIGAAMGRRLKNWGILNIHIEGDEDDTTSAASAEVTPGEVKEKLEKKFSRVMDNGIMKTIFAAVYQYKIHANG